MIVLRLISNLKVHICFQIIKYTYIIIFQGCGLTMITGFCTAINPIDFTLWTSIVLLFGMMIGILLSSIFRFFFASSNSHRLSLEQRRALMAKGHLKDHYPMEMEFYEDEKCRRIRRRSPDKEQWTFISNVTNILTLTLCSRKLQNVELMLDFVEIGSFFRHSDFTQIKFW